MPFFEKLIILWRVISIEELKDIHTYKKLRLHEGGFEMKPFASSYDDAHKFAKLDGLYRGKKFFIVATIINELDIESYQRATVDGGIKEICLTKDQLALVNPVILGKMPRSKTQQRLDLIKIFIYKLFSSK